MVRALAVPAASSRPGPAVNDGRARRDWGAAYVLWPRPPHFLPCGSYTR